MSWRDAGERAADAEARYRALSLWHDTVDDDLTPRPALDGDLDADVAIVGAGLTGLWTAWYLARLDPALRIVILDSEIAGFGASGRNGGWVSALFPRGIASLEREHGRAAAVAQRRAMVDTVDEVGRAASEAGIDSGFVKGGTLVHARSAVQLAAARSAVAEAAAYGVDRLELRGGSDAEVRAAGSLGAVFDPACARVHPAALTRGLARAVERRGVRIFEGTAAREVVPRRVTTRAGTVRAEHVVIATEAYGSRLQLAGASGPAPATGRRILPLYSLMIATAPLPAELWERIRMPHGRTFSDQRHLVIYGQRTVDDRIAFGGRGARYHWMSHIRDDYDRVPRVFAHLERTLRELYPALAEVPITHRWGGPLGVPRDWHASVGLDATTGIAWAGGYVGDGLATTNLAGRTLADLLSGRDTELTGLPWVGHRSPAWEPEPLRFLGANAGLAGTAFADAEERMTGRPSLAARLLAPLTGH